MGTGPGLHHGEGRARSENEGRTQRLLVVAGDGAQSVDEPPFVHRRERGVAQRVCCRRRLVIHLTPAQEDIKKSIISIIQEAVPPCFKVYLCPAEEGEQLLCVCTVEGGEVLPELDEADVTHWPR